MEEPIEVGEGKQDMEIAVVLETTRKNEEVNVAPILIEEENEDNVDEEIEEEVFKYVDFVSNAEYEDEDEVHCENTQVDDEEIGYQSVVSEKPIVHQAFHSEGSAPRNPMVALDLPTLD